MENLLNSFVGNYLSEHADEAEKFLTAAKIISAPWDVTKSEDLVQISIHI